MRVQQQLLAGFKVSVGRPVQVDKVPYMGNYVIIRMCSAHASGPFCCADLDGVCVVRLMCDMGGKTTFVGIFC